MARTKKKVSETGLRKTVRQARNNEADLQIRFLDGATRLFHANWPEQLLHPHTGAARAPFYSVPNEGVRSFALATRLRGMGLAAGIPDLCLPIPRADYPGMYIEFKKPSFKDPEKHLGPNQIIWRDFLISQGYKYLCTNDYEVAIEALIDYMCMAR